MEDLAEPRETFVLSRGRYEMPDKDRKVEPGVPACLPTPAADAPRNRLGLARWLVAPDHPLTARVAVNRFWQQIFGTGLVKTAEDFGVQGEVADAPRAARLARHRVRPHRLGREGDAPADRHQRHLPAVVAGSTRRGSGATRRTACCRAGRASGCRPR